MTRDPILFLLIHIAAWICKLMLLCLFHGRESFTFVNTHTYSVTIFVFGFVLRNRNRCSNTLHRILDWYTFYRWLSLLYILDSLFAWSNSIFCCNQPLLIVNSLGGFMFCWMISVVLCNVHRVQCLWQCTCHRLSMHRPFTNYWKQKSAFEMRTEQTNKQRTNPNTCKWYV